MRLTVEQVAELCHEANRIYCQFLGDVSQVHWTWAPEWQKDSAINGVHFHLDNVGASPAQSHENWLKEKEADGWVYGEVKDEKKKTHPCCVPYDELPLEQRIKDSLFGAIVEAVKDLL